MKNRIYILWLILLVCSATALASTPNYETSVLLKNEVINGNNIMGNVVFIESPYISEYSNFSTFGSHNAQQYDILTWKDSQTIKIISPTLVETILVNNASFYITETGVHNFVSLTNSSNTGNVIVSNKDVNSITFNNIIVPSGFVLTFSKNNFVLQNEEVITTNLIVDEDVPTGDYLYSFKINDKTYNKTVKVLQNLAWEITTDEIKENLTAFSGENVYVGHLILTNLGNDDITITINKYGEQKHLLIVPQAQKLFKKSTLRLEFSVQVPTTQKPGVFFIPVNISGGGLNEGGNLTITVKDNIKPVIESINFSSSHAFVENKINVIATDNNNVTEVTMQYDDKTIILDKDEQLFTTKITFNKLSRYLINFCAYDADENKECVLVNKTFEEIRLIENFNNTIVLPAKKISQYSKSFLFDLNTNVPEGIKIVLKDFSAMQSATGESVTVVRIVDGDGTVKTFDMYEKEVVIKNKGKIYLEVRSTEPSDFNGLLNIIQPEYAVEVSSLSFTVSFKDYDVPQSFVRPWNHETDITCNVKDTGNLATTFYECSFKAPINIRPEDISIPTTISERKTFEDQATQIQDKLTKSRRFSATMITILLALLIVLLFFSYYMLYHYPYVRMSYGHELKYKYNKQGDKEHEF